MCGCGGGGRKVKGKKIYESKGKTAVATKKYVPKLKPSVKRLLNKKKLKKK